MSKHQPDVPGKFGERMNLAFATCFFAAMMLSLPPSWSNFGLALAGSSFFLALWYWFRQARLAAQFRADFPGYTIANKR